MLKRFLVAVALSCPWVALPEASAAGQNWYPRASDLCAEYVIKVSKSDPRFGKLVTPTKDPAIAKYVADFNAATGASDKGGSALIYLVGYCNTHALTKLGDVTAQMVIANDKANQANSPTQPAPADTSALETWYRQTLNTCPSSDDECRRIAKKIYDDSLACYGGDAKACSNWDNNNKERDRWNAEQRNRAAQSNPQNALMQCLQDRAMSVLKSCKQKGCTADAAFESIRQVQLAFCGYSAIQPIQSSQPLTNCFTTPAPGGGWITTCTEF